MPSVPFSSFAKTARFASLARAMRNPMIILINWQLAAFQFRGR